MAAGPALLYDAFLERIGLTTSDWVNDNHYAILLTSSFTHVDTHSTLADISANEIGDYDTSGPQDLTGESVAATGSTTKFDAVDVDFGNTVTITARNIAVLEGTVALKGGTDKLCFSAALDDTTDYSSSGGDFDVAWNASGIFDMNQAA